MRSTSTPAPVSWPAPGTHSRFVELNIEALTPIYKGGSTTTQIDEGQPFRAPSIRGALRYWWRATSTIQTVSDLRAEEERIFGGVHGQGPIASAVSVAILAQSSTPDPRPANKAYAFGVTGKEPEDHTRSRQVHSKATGKLRLEWREDGCGEQVKRSLQAWLLFGGIGGRSRRGAGSVWWSGGIDVPANLDNYISRWRSSVQERANELWPTLSGGALLVGPSKNFADDAWVEGLSAMKDVRASEGIRHNFISFRGGLREWKEKDYVPICSGKSFDSPRAALGLPIRFRSETGFNGVLQAADHNRYPSPIHLKVIRLGKQYRPVFTVLRGPAPIHLQAKQVRGKLDTKGLDRFLDLAAQLPDWTCHRPGEQP